jgi:hypothetical protein
MLGKDLQVSPGAAPPLIEIVYSNHIGSAEGTVNKDDHVRVAGAVVVFIPDPPLRREFSRYSEVKTDQSGHFSVPSLAPGNYKVFAWDRIEDGEYEDPEFLRSCEDAGKAIEIVEGQKTTVALALTVNPEQ